MSHSAETRVQMDEDPLNIGPGSGEDTAITMSRQPAASCCKDRHHRKLAICSIICGITCIGILALINSVKAGEAKNGTSAKYYSRRARKLGVISIVVWLILLLFTPAFLVLVSYILTLRE
ncbi:transmembrane protein 265-like [Genypterus blacodes]|uniref:transmembrane protein 265-like n=1 Tax=Genypterus blacodes TaxID=154954 RepID=UPI003F766E36